MTCVRTVVLNALDATIGIKGNPEFVRAQIAGDDIDLAELNIDSLSRMEAIMLIEEALDIEIDDDEVLEQKTVNGLIAYIEPRVGPAADASRHP
ncbi:acyl carrier protein [Citreimonas salinaria]|uniref:Acyl carrier protein n=1 Tax=Citreimonas salinaria TaxID=321339 RepID=A0A1H3LRD8_9RHOB|nr:phosphopantetheine-binding protein [Citreimonas salinaria]SDY66890.1 acyl carrier protein [Citreimonas salinaria]